ncbi:FAD binding domain-containing protein [Phytoactinopolyspora limicola]|uniref:FAD binding domain-containing protein n=1 Tax=Phytoactinopolyspora limicola TaxID=2715536 RepID=UPI00140E5563|nr:FAD binding domain-containing protein [Phytoactinopolyspora limicola]
MSGRILLSAATESAADRLCATARPVAGGTDLLVHGLDAAPVNLVDLSRLAGRRRPVSRLPNGSIRVSATAPLSVITSADVPVPAALADAIAEFASPQIRNRATIGGNIANGSPAADLVPPLVVCDAIVGVRGSGGRRDVPIGDLLVGPGRTTLAPGEWIEYVDLAPVHHSGFRKLGYRRALAIAVVSLAWSWTRPGSGPELADVRLAAGAVAPTVVRCTRAEAALRSLRPDDVGAAARAIQDDITPIDDLRASAHYRAGALAGLVCELPMVAAHRGGKTERL